MSGYVLFVLRSLLAGRPMLPDGFVAEWGGVPPETVVRARERNLFLPWLCDELRRVLRTELLSADVVEATELNWAAESVEAVSTSGQAGGRLAHGARVKLGRRWFELPALPPTPPNTTRRRTDDAAPSVARAA
jgi:hypothetical protein